MNPLYIIGNGTRSLRDVQSLKDKTTLSMNISPDEYGDWGFLPNYYCCLELNQEYKQCIIDYLFARRIFEPQYDGIIKILPDFIRNDLPRAVNCQFYPYVFHDLNFSLTHDDAIVQVGCTGANATLAAMNILKYEKIILLGMNGFRDFVDEPQDNTTHHKHWEEDYESYRAHCNHHLERGWNRIARWIQLKPWKGEILNASEKTTIQHFPQIKLGEEDA